ncbi:MAG: YbbR-like domain-containing protein [Bacteroidales bacterium]|nr:YbbR-like domain-containing protein [Bacteroidales bacterium]
MRGRQVRSFLVVLGITALVWLAMAMSESREYNLPVKVRFSGYDAKRYAVARIDTSLTLKVEATGFNAMFYSLRREPPTVQLDMNSELVYRYVRRRGEVTDLYRSVAVNDLSSQISTQLDAIGIHYVGSAKDSLQLVLNERASRTYIPDLGDLRINFSDGYGLYGEPQVTPGTVTLYGPRDVLDTIERVCVKPVVLNKVLQSGTFVVSLDASWRQVGDVYSSVDAVSVYIPVKRFIERRFTVPVTVDDADSTHALRLYPDHVEIDVWVAQDELASVSADRFTVSASYDDILSGLQRLKLRVSRFPRNVRIRSVNPKEIEYVIIK